MKIRYYALWLSLICIIVFVLQLLIPGFTDLLVLDGNSYLQVWRFLTAIFLHAGVAHIVANLFALALFGTLLEKFIGSKKFLAIFFASGIFANLIAVNFYPSSLGASGAIMGILGTLIVVRPMMTVWVSGMPMPMFIAGLVWAATDIMGVFVPSGVGNIAHLSGLGMGLIFGFVLRDWTKKKEQIESLRLNEQYMQDWEDKYI